MKRFRDLRELLKKGAYLVEPGKRGRWVALILLAVFVSLLEAVGALLMFVLVRLIVDPTTDVSLPVFGTIDAFAGAEANQVVLIFAAITAGFSLGRGGVYLVQAYAQHRIAHGTGVRMSARLLSGYLSAPYTFHLQRNTSELIRNGFYSVSEVVSNFFVPAVGLLSETLVIVGVFAALTVVAPTGVGLGVVVLAPVVALLLAVLQPRLRRLGVENQKFYQESLYLMQQGLQGVREVKVFQKGSFFTDLYFNSRAKYARTMYLRTVLVETPRVVIEVVAVLFMLLFLLGSQIVAENPEESLASLGVFAYALLRAMPSLNRILWNTNLLRFGSAAVDLVHRDLRDLAPRGMVAVSSSSPVPFEHVIDLDDVWARYPGSETDALRGITMTLHRGEFIGIVGPTGGGKSTLVDVILGLIPPSKGRITVDGVDIQDDLSGWLAKIAVVSQTPFLLDDSIRRNVAFGVRDEDIDEAKVDEALRAAQLLDFVSGLPNGSGSVVGERGVRISGGQRQRIAIARALYKGADVLILDEGTSALDVRTEAEFLKEIGREWRDKTIIAVAHRLTTVKGCDRIFMIESGGISGMGTYDELRQANPSFRGLTM